MARVTSIARHATSSGCQRTRKAGGEEGGISAFTADNLRGVTVDFRLDAAQSSAPPKPPSPWWRTRAPLLPLLLHLLYLLGLCQLQLTDADVGRILGPSDQTRSVSAVVARGGVLGTAALYFGVHEPVELYHRYAEAFLRGRDPQRARPDDPAQGHLKAYRDVPIEYQPGKLLFMVPPALASSRYDVYLRWFVLWTGLIYLGAVLGAFALVGDGSASQATQVLWWSFAMLLLFGPYTSAHLDQAVALICVWGWLLFRQGWRGGSPGWFLAFGSLTAMGVLVKIVPGVLLPAGWIALLCGAQRPRWRDAVLAGIGFVITLGGLHALCVAIWGDGYLASYTYHLQRGIQIESTWAGVLMAGRRWLGPLSSAYNFGSYHLATPYTPVVAVLFPVTLAAVTCLAAWRARQAHDAVQTDPLPVLTLVVLLTFVLTNKVFSFNYLLWLTPLVPALLARARRWLPGAVLYAVALGLTQLWRVYDYAFAKISMPWQSVLVLNLRNFTLVILLTWLLWRLPQLLAEPRPEPE